MSGTIAEQAEKSGVDKVLFMGFLDGINDSLKEKNEDLEEMTEESRFELDIDFEKLYFNMLDAKADYLYTLPEWDDILTEEKREEIAKAYRRSKTVVKSRRSAETTHVRAAGKSIRSAAEKICKAEKERRIVVSGIFADLHR